MTPLTLYLLRHGESELNARRIFAGRSVDPPLSPVGLQEAARQAKALREVHFSALYSSPLRRARQTAAAVAAGRPLEVRIDDRLKEVDLGALDGQQIDDPVNQAAYRAVISQWEAGRPEARFDGGESLLDMERRFTAFLQAVKRRQPDGPVLVVAHGVLFMGVLWRLVDHHGPALKDVYMGRGHLSIISGDDDRFQIDQFNLAPPDL